MGQKASAPVSQAQVKEREATDPRYHYLQSEPERLRVLEAHAASTLQQIFTAEKDGPMEVDLRRSGLKALPLSEAVTAEAQSAPVTTVLLAFNRLQKFPPILASWAPTLKTLDLSCNHLHGEVAEGTFGTFSALHTLKLSRNGLTSSWLVPLLQSVPCLRYLDLSHNPLTTWPSLPSSLQLLDLRFCNLETLPHTRFEHLQILRLDGNRIREIPEEFFSDTLLGLSLEGNPISALPDISCSSLQVLNAGRLHLTSFPSTLAASCVSSLKVLEIKCSNLSEFPAAVVGLTSLTKLSLTGATFASVPESLDLPVLTHLILRFNKLGQVPHCRTPLLQVLDLAGNALSSLQILDDDKKCDTCSNASPSSPWSAHFPQLTALSVACNSLASPEALCAADLLALPHLRHLNLDGNPLVASARRALEQPGPARVLNHLLKPESPPPAVSLNPFPGSVRDAILGCVVGCALGDAVGLSTEFMQRVQAMIHYHAALPLWAQAAAPNPDLGEVESALVELSQGAEWLEDAHRSRWLRGDFTDDTDQLLLILDNICDGKGTVNAGLFAQSIYRWAKEGFSELGDQAGMGIGSTVAAVLRHQDFLPPPMAAKYEPHRSARQVWENMNKSAAANGSVMRVAVLGVPNFWDEQAVGAQTREISAVTHVDPRTMASCLVVTHLVAAMLRTVEQQTAGETKAAELFSPPWVDRAVEVAVEYAAKQCSGTDKSAPSRVGLPPDHLTELKWHCAPERTLRELDLENTKQMGYTYKALGAAIWALRQPDFMHALHLITLEAGDADTNGAVAGALLGTRVGFSHLPSQWMAQFPHRSWLLERAEKLADTVLAAKR